MQIDESDEQSLKAECSIDKSREPASNVTVERDSHSDKHSSPSLSTQEGRQIDLSDEQPQNEDSAMDESLEPGSNTTIERE
jgi:hypothetical protein